MSERPLIDEARQLYQRKDDEHWVELQKVVAESNISFSEMLINYPAFIRRREMVRLLADYDLFRMVLDLPGSIAELGVFLGAGLFTWSKLLETFVPGDRSRRVYGFESGEGYRQLAPEDGNPGPWIENVVGRKVVPAGYLDQMVRLTNLDNLIPGVGRCRVISGNILETVPHFAENNQGIRFCLLFLDVNLYQPTLAGLRAFYPLLVPGGIVALNGFGSPPWLGETVAFEHYFAEIGRPLPRLHKLQHSIRPGAYFIKE
jgi:hypothetical protein